MKLVTFDTGDGIARPGAFVNDDTGIVDLAAATGGAISSIQALIEGGDGAFAKAQDIVSKGSADAETANVRLLAPIPRPEQMRDCLCFELHLKQASAAGLKVRVMNEPDPEAAERELIEAGFLIPPKVFYEQPLYYKANRFAVIGHEQDVQWPAYSDFMDFELEFGVYISKPTKDVKAEDATPHIFGYTIFNDMTARDAQMKEMQAPFGPAKGKDFDTANVMGPCIVTADEFGDPYNKSMICRVNGEEWGRGSTSSMMWKFEDLIAHISRSETLHPGEFLGSGTVGNGCGVEHMRKLNDGDVVELEVEGIGILRNRIVKS
ncbi:MAG: fumarylacetoacetate hydrolase family protein [Pseudomonadota bacterium]|nr:fumarylacetoacetate hydrolase family protein [Pseudomonadota bacterium]